MVKRKKSDDEVVDRAAAEVKKQFKDMPSGSGIEELRYPTLWASTGSLSLDRACRGFNPGGVPIGPRQGSIVHLAGDESTGKTLILDHLFKSVIDAGGRAVCSETEGTRNPHFADAIGLDLRKVYIMRPETLEQAFDSGLVYAGSIHKDDPTVPVLWGIDSVASTEAKRTADHDLTDTGVFHYGGGKSQALSEGLRRISNYVSRFPLTLVLLNQTRINPMVLFGSKKVTPGGKPLAFFPSLSIMLSVGPKGDTRSKYAGAKLTKEQRTRLGMRATERGDVIGRWIRAKITKSKVSDTHAQEADFYVSFTRGVHKWAGLLQKLLQEGMIELVEKDHIKHGEQVFGDDREWLTWLAENLDTLSLRKEKNDGS